MLERRTKHRLARIAERLEVLEGYLAVYLNIDKVIKIIRTEDEPKPKLMSAFKINDRQAEAILNMRLRALRRLEEVQIKEEHASLTKEQKDLKKLLGSDKLLSEKLIEEMKAVDAKFGLKTELGKRRTDFSSPPDVAEDFSAEALIEKEPITVICSQKLWLRSMKGHQEENDAVKYREGDRGRFWIHAETTDKTDDVRDRRPVLHARLLEAAGRARERRSRSAASSTCRRRRTSSRCSCTRRAQAACSPRTPGHGFVTNEDEAVAMTRSGKKVMNVPTGIEAQACAFVAGDTVAVLGENRKLLIFPLEEVPELGRGRGVILQRYKDGGLADAASSPGAKD